MKKAQVVIISLWILVILTILAVSIGHRVSMALRLSCYQRDRTKSYCLAKAGISRAIVELEKDAADPNTKDYDILNDGWANNEKTFKNILLDESKKDEFVTVSYKVQDREEPFYGVRDEESRININGISNIDKKILLLELFKIKNIDTDEELNKLADTIVKWTNKAGEDEDKIFKKAPLKTPEELLLILEYFYKDKDKEKARKVYDAAKDLITVCETKAININTASGDVLTILAKSVAPDKNPSTLITEITTRREKNPFVDQATIENFSVSDFNLQNIYNEMKKNFTYQSDYFKIASQGKVGNITKNITAIYDRQEHKIVYWHEN